MDHYTPKPRSIEGMRWDGTPESATPIIDWVLGKENWTANYCDGPHRGINTPVIHVHSMVEGLHENMAPGDYIMWDGAEEENEMFIVVPQKYFDKLFDTVGVMDASEVKAGTL